MIHKIAISLADNLDYEDGIPFIHKYGDGAVADKLEALSRSSFTDMKLVRALLKIAYEYEEDQIAEKTDNSLVTTLGDSEKSKLEELKEQRNRKISLIEHKRGQLELINNDADRLKVALEIVQARKDYFEIWGDINLLEAGKPLPKQEELEGIDKVFDGVTMMQVPRIRTNYISYLSKAKKGLRPQEMIPFYESVIAEAERRINAV